MGKLNEIRQVVVKKNDDPIMSDDIRQTYMCAHKNYPLERINKK